MYFLLDVVAKNYTLRNAVRELLGVYLGVSGDFDEKISGFAGDFCWDFGYFLISYGCLF